MTFDLNPSTTLLLEKVRISSDRAYQEQVEHKPEWLPTLPGFPFLCPPEHFLAIPPAG